MTAIGGNYPTPVQVNGFTCKNCTDVDYARKHIDPAHPKSSPYDIAAATAWAWYILPLVPAGLISLWLVAKRNLPNLLPKMLPLVVVQRLRAE